MLRLGRPASSLAAVAGPEPGYRRAVVHVGQALGCLLPVCLQLATGGCVRIHETRTAESTRLREDVVWRARAPELDRVVARRDANGVRVWRTHGCRLVLEEREVATVRVVRKPDTALLAAEGIFGGVLGTVFIAGALAKPHECSPEEQRRDTCSQAPGAFRAILLVAGIAAIFPFVYDLAQHETKRVEEARWTGQRRNVENECDRTPIVRTPVVLRSAEGEVISGESDGEGRVVLPRAYLPVAVSVAGGSEIPIAIELPPWWTPPSSPSMQVIALRRGA
jgi:hypothetical protein